MCLQVPCLTYGMRGMIAASVEVKGPARDLHSGNDGGPPHPLSADPVCQTEDCPKRCRAAQGDCLPGLADLRAEPSVSTDCALLACRRVQ